MDIINNFTLNEFFLIFLGAIIILLIYISRSSSKQKKKEKNLNEILNIYTESMEAYHDGVLITSGSNEVIFANKEAKRILTISGLDIDKKYIRNRVRIRMSGSEAEEGFLDAIAKRRNIPHANVLIGSSPTPVSISTYMYYMNFQDEDSWRLTLIRDISDKIKREEKLEKDKLYRDLLTELPVRHHMVSDIVSLVMRSAQSSSNLAIGICSIDNFDALRVKYSIEKIDIVLRSIAKNISSALDRNETIYRFDCNKFAIVFHHDAKDKERVIKRTDWIRVKAQNEFFAANIKAELRNGVYFMKDSDTSAESVINSAFKMISDGINIVNSSASELSHKKSSTEEATSKYLGSKLSKEDFLDSIKNQDFFFYYQPIFNLQSMHMVGVEALIRLNHKKYGFLAASDFMDKAIEYDIVSKITPMMLQGVLKQKVFWSAVMGANLDMTINISLSDLQTESFFEIFKKNLKEFNIDPESVIVDIPEAALIDDYNSVLKGFSRLKDMGLKLSVDHFGKDFTNLKCLENLNLNIIKVDGSITEGIAKSHHKAKLVSGITSMCKGMGLKVGVSHIETNIALEALLDTKCDFVQGNYLGRPVQAFEITKAVKRSSKSV